MGEMDRLAPRVEALFDVARGHSHDLEWRDLVALRRTLLDVHKSGERSVLVSTGTDTLEEVAYFLSIIAPPDIAIAIVAALRPASDLESDAVRSLAAAVEWLEDPARVGVSVAVDGLIFETPLVDKIFQNGRWLFRTSCVSNTGLPGWRLNPDHQIAPEPPQVPVLALGLGDTRTAIEFLSRPIHGVVVSAFAGGDVPASLVSTLVALVDRGTPVVLTSRSHPGIVTSGFTGVAGASADLLGRGLLSGVELDYVRARIRLMVALAAIPKVAPAAVFSNR